MKKIIISGFLIILIFQAKSQENLKIFIKQDTTIIEITDSITLKNKPFEFIFEIDLEKNPIKNNYFYSLNYVSSIEKNAYREYIKIGTIKKHPEFVFANNMASDLFNTDSCIAITDNYEYGYGYLYTSSDMQMTFNNAEFIDGILNCYLYVSNFGIKIGKYVPVEKLKNKEVCFLFNFDNLDKIILIKFED